jgi:hypothetical protein
MVLFCDGTLPHAFHSSCWMDQGYGTFCSAVGDVLFDVFMVGKLTACRLFQWYFCHMSSIVYAGWIKYLLILLFIIHRMDTFYLRLCFLQSEILTLHRCGSGVTSGRVAGHAICIERARMSGADSLTRSAVGPTSQISGVTPVVGELPLPISLPNPATSAGRRFAVAVPAPVLSAATYDAPYTLLLDPPSTSARGRAISEPLCGAPHNLVASLASSNRSGASPS